MKHKNYFRYPFSVVLLLIIFIQLFTACNKKSNNTQVITPATALQSYLNNRDTTFSWKLRATTASSAVKIYSLLLTSQQWHGITWRHTLTVIVPDDIKYDGALLFITGGKNKDGMPVKRSHDDEFIAAMSKIAMKNHAVVTVVWQVPNQPLFDDLTEDKLISYTLHQFENDSDYTWPLLFPMVKSAVRAMDAVQSFLGKQGTRTINRFVVSGGSKRGWTTWLTGAMDKRVEAIAPMVIDVLNMPVNLDYQVKVWGDYSVQIEDYVKLGIPQDVHTGKGSAITQMVDPYSYRSRLNMPKMIINGTNDEYWPVDAIKNYLDSIPGQNYLLYVPNAGHGLGDTREALNTLSAFFGRTIAHKAYPLCKWKIKKEDDSMDLTVEITPDVLQGAYLWSAGSKDRDFRDETWSSKEIGITGNKYLDIQVALPDSGFKAFFVDLKYSDPDGGTYLKSTRMFVAGSTGVFGYDE